MDGENEARELGPEAGATEARTPGEAAAVYRRMPEEEIAVYWHFVEKDFESRYFDEERARLWPGDGPARGRALNGYARKLVKLFKEHSARRLEEYEAKGYIEYGPPVAKLSPSGSPRDQGK